MDPAGLVAVGAVDADAHKDLGGQYEVKGFPTIKVGSYKLISLFAYLFFTLM
jgi:hypothetical protein